MIVFIVSRLYYIRTNQCGRKKTMHSPLLNKKRKRLTLKRSIILMDAELIDTFRGIGESGT
jgi:hypothetical protein